MKPLIIGVSGSSGSGKTSITEKIIASFPEQKIIYIKQDNYYKDQDHLPFAERLQTNYDHPQAFDNELLLKHIEQLKDNKDVAIPNYDFINHTRLATTTHLP